MASLCVAFSIQLWAQKDSSQRDPKFSIHLESGVLAVHSENSPSLHCYTGQLGMAYSLSTKLHLGIFGQTLLYHQNLDLVNISNKIIDMGSVDYTSFGLFISYYFKIKKIRLEPKLDLGYNIFNAKGIDYDLDPSSFLDYRYVSAIPKLHLHYQVSESFSLGVFGGYNIQLAALKGEKTRAFDPNGYTIGVSARIYIPR